MTIKDFKKSAKLMLSPDYKERFKAEYIQLKYRCKRLDEMLEKNRKGELDIPPLKLKVLSYQLTCMLAYLHVLKARASVEKLELC